MTEKKSNKRQLRDILFYVALVAWPVVQFAIFYIGVNFNSIMLAFKEIDPDTLKTANMGFGLFWENVKYFFESAQLLVDSQLTQRFWNMLSYSLLSWVLSVVISVPLGLFFSYYISKKMPLHGAFRVILFLPSILSTVVVATMFKTFVGQALPQISEEIFHIKMESPLMDPTWKYTFYVVEFYCIWVSFGTSVLMYSNSMSEIPPEIIESARLDGANSLQEFWHISLPSIFPTLSVFLVTGVAGIFTNQMNLYSLYSYQAGDLITVGYLLYVKTGTADNAITMYPPLSAFGIILTAIAVPVTLATRHLLDKYGPSED